MIQSNFIRVGYQGVSGCYSEQAILTCMTNTEVEAIGYPDFPSTFKGLAKGEVNQILIPVENSLGGSIHLNGACLRKKNTSSLGV